jgi:hypothetical protein
MLVSLQPLQRNTTGTFTNKAVYQFGKELHEQACSASSYRKATGHAPLITTSVGAASAAKPFKNSKGIAARQYIAMRQRMRCTYQAAFGHKNIAARTGILPFFKRHPCRPTILFCNSSKK